MNTTTNNNKISILLNEKSYITAVARGGVLQDGIDVDDFEFTEDIQAYKYSEGKIELDRAKLQQLQAEQSAHEELQELQETLAETDLIALQRWEESELGLKHELPEQEFQEVIQKRQRIRLKIKQLNEVITCSKPL